MESLSKCDFFCSGIYTCKIIDFIPGREMQSISSRGSIFFTYVLFWVSKGILDFLKNVLSPKGDA